MGDPLLMEFNDLTVIQSSSSILTRGGGADKESHGRDTLGPSREEGPACTQVGGPRRPGAPGWLGHWI